MGPSCPRRNSPSTIGSEEGERTWERTGSAALREAVHRSTEAAAAREHIERFFAPHLEETFAIG
jgi:hypothetical protein